jgi:hypothetical protein
LKLELSDQQRETCNICVVQQYYSFKIDLYLQVEETRVFLCASASLFKIQTLSSGGRDSRCFLCAAALVSNISTFCSGGRYLPYFLSVSAFLVNIWVLSSGERDCQYFCCSAA